MIREHLYNLQFILLHKPELGVSLVEIKKLYETRFDEPIITDPEILRHRLSSNLALVIKNPDIPVKCLLYTRFYSISWYIVIAIGGTYFKPSTAEPRLSEILFGFRL